MRLFNMPMLSTFNGPSYLLHAVETLLAIGLPEANIRLVPVMAWQNSPEIMPYYDRFEIGDAALEAPESIFARLLINVRDDNRLRRFAPLVAIGLAPQKLVAGWRLAGRGPADHYRDVYPRLVEIDPEWTNRETPAERLTRQLYAQIPELRPPGTRAEAPTERMWLRSEGQWKERANPFFGAAKSREIASDDPHQTVHELVEMFFTYAFQFLAAADAIGGMEYELQAKPEGRQIGFTLTPTSDVSDVVRWLHTYPHRPLSRVDYPQPDDREAAEWNEYFAQCPDHDNIFVTGPLLWTEQDPAILNLFEEFKAREWEAEAIGSDAMLSLAWKHLPDYVPHYPHASAVTGGLNTEGILITLMGRWLQEGPFLGMTLDLWDLFTEAEQVILCGLLMRRRNAVDQCELFVAAVRLLVDPGIMTSLEAYRLEPVRLGKPFAQPGRTLSLTGVIALHAPSLQVRIPLDRTENEDSVPLEQKIKMLGRLFLPVHIPLELIWDVDWMSLQGSGYLLHGAGDDRVAVPASRIEQY
jgi:hypothetical protein